MNKSVRIISVHKHKLAEKRGMPVKRLCARTYLRTYTHVRTIFRALIKISSA